MSLTIRLITRNTAPFLKNTSISPPFRFTGEDVRRIDIAVLHRVLKALGAFLPNAKE